MESDSDYEVEESVVVHVEAAGVIPEDLHLTPATQINFIQVDSETPLVQIGGHVYLGTYQDTAGTSLLFRQQVTPVTEQVDPVFGHHVPSTVTFLDATRKKLKLKRVFLKEAATKPAAEETNKNSKSDNNQVNLLT